MTNRPQFTIKAILGAILVLSVPLALISRGVATGDKGGIAVGCIWLVPAGLIVAQLLFGDRGYIVTLGIVIALMVTLLYLVQVV